LYIKEVELKNFKSFGKRVLIPLYNDFIAVTGPNGSGKSNIVDALLFALCLSNSRAMRAERLPDLIYRGDNGHNPDFAEVKVRLDNSSRTMPVDLDTIEVCRKIKVNNDKYASSYYFNGKSCTHTELQDYLSKVGINPDGYNIVMQGDVTRIIEMTPVERRKIIDEIAGVAEFDEKKKKSMEELEVVKDRIGRVDIILEEVGFQLGRLKDERDRALSYQAHRDELRRQEAFLLLARLSESKGALTTLDAESAALREKIDRLNLKSATKNNELATLDEQLKGLNSEIAFKGEDEQLQVKRKIEELKGERAREEGRIELAARTLEEVESQSKACYIQMEKIRQESVELSSRMGDAGIRGASLQGELEDQSALFDAARKKIAEADSQYSKLRDDLSGAMQIREALKANLGDLIRERDRLLDASRRGTSERDEIDVAIEETKATLAAAERETEEIKAELAELNKKALDREKDRDDLEGAKLKVRREIAESDRELQRLSGEYAKSEGRLRASEDRSGYSRAVEAVRSAIKRQMLTGLYGTIAELGDVSSKYSAALEVAAGARLQSIVADNDEDASIAIDYLKRSQIGRATFLPLNRLERRDLVDKPDRPGVIDYALNLVDFDPKFAPAFWYVFRDTLVVETLSDARRLMGRYRMVTLEGDLVEKSGAMTGGHYKSRLKFAADESSKLAEISEKIASAEAERNTGLNRLDEIEEKISRLSRDVDELDKVISKKTFRIEEIQSARPRLEKVIQEKTDRLSQMGGESQSFRERLNSLEIEVHRIEEALAEEQQKISRIEGELAGSNIPELAASAALAEGEAKRLQERIREIDSDILKDRIRTDSGAEKLKELQGRREALESQRSEALERKRVATERISAIETEMREVAVREAEIEVELHGLKSERGILGEQLLALQKELDLIDREMDKTEARLMAADAAAAQTRAQVESLRSEIEACGVDSNQEPPRSETVAQKIKALETAMQELEPVNMLAIEEYDRVLKRHSILQERRETLNNEREAIIDKLNKYDLMKKEAFLSTFLEINRNFNDIFKELSKGEGELILEFPDDPLGGGMTIKARPAGKPFHRLEAMSGGEKSLTALSFIFAIQMFRPAPFYAMDEIDMFLDGVNAERVAKLIKKISSRAQFLVVSLRKPMIQQAKYTIGVTMQEDNISSATGICTS
jgi:chromosome segregation protein